MCLILLAWRLHPRYPLVVAANRDEFHARRTAPARLWEDAPGLLAGRDLEAGGTWLGVERRARFAALTNFRDPTRALDRAPSRGALVTNFLTGPDAPPAHIRRVASTGARYNGFNLIVADLDEAWWYSNRGGPAERLTRGVHGVSNGRLDDAWPKVASGRHALAGALAGGAEPDVDALLAILADRSRPPDARLPDTGIGIARERRLAPRFILDDVYGTRSSTVMLMDERGRAVVVERTFDSAGTTRGEQRCEIGSTTSRAP